MLRWAILFLIVGLIAGFFGFFQAEGTAMWMARVLCILFLITFVVSLIFGSRSPQV